MNEHTRLNILLQIARRNKSHLEVTIFKKYIRFRSWKQVATPLHPAQSRQHRVLLQSSPRRFEFHQSRKAPKRYGNLNTRSTFACVIVLDYLFLTVGVFTPIRHSCRKNFLTNQQVYDYIINHKGQLIIQKTWSSPYSSPTIAWAIPLKLCNSPRTTFPFLQRQRSSSDPFENGWEDTNPIGIAFRVIVLFLDGDQSWQTLSLLPRVCRKDARNWRRATWHEFVGGMHRSEFHQCL